MKYLTPFRWGRRNMPAGREYEAHPLDVFQREMNRLFDDFFKGAGLKPWSEEMEDIGAFNPQVNMTEDDKSITVSAELPGLEEKDIEISLSKDSLTIKGEKKEENEHKGKEAYYMERSYGAFTRCCPSPRRSTPRRPRRPSRRGCSPSPCPSSRRRNSRRRRSRSRPTDMHTFLSLR